jgi:hypothetical protein
MSTTKRMEILIWRHATPAQKLKGMATLYLRVTVAGDREDFGSTGIKIYSDRWNEVTQRVKPTDPLAHFKNEQLSLLESRLWAIYNNLLRKGEGISANRIRRLYTIPDSITYMAAFEMFQKKYNARGDIAASSKKTLKNIKQVVLRYLIENNLQDILIEEFDEEVMKEYCAWCKGKGYKESYMVRTARGAKQITAYARKKKWIDLDPLENFAVPHEKIVPPKYVNSTQLNVWMNHKFMHPTAQRVADLFVLYARTGFHYQDLIQIIRNPAAHITQGIDGAKWIFKDRQKTEVTAKIPIARFPEIQRIVDRYGSWEKLPQFDNSTMNDWLKLCVAEINLKLPPAQQIYNQLSVKHGRSTFCDYCINELGFENKPLMTMMGRVSEAELSRYVRADERAVIKAFAVSDSAMAS